MKCLFCEKAVNNPIRYSEPTEDVEDYTFCSNICTLAYLYEHPDFENVVEANDWLVKEIEVLAQREMENLKK